MNFRVIYLFLFVSFSTLLFSQENLKESKSYPVSILDLGLGTGANHGMYGYKAVLGYKGTGLLIGMGVNKGLGSGVNQGKFVSQYGFQISYRPLYVSISNGDYGSYEELGETLLARGTIVVGGVKVNLKKDKTFYFEMGVGYGTGHRYRDENNRLSDFNRILYNLGIGVRIG